MELLLFEPDQTLPLSTSEAKWWWYAVAQRLLLDERTLRSDYDDHDGDDENDGNGDGNGDGDGKRDGDGNGDNDGSGDGDTAAKDGAAATLAATTGINKQLWARVVDAV
eukprot:3640196-Pleurochrysis_carterae.AAC.1